ncbi:MAG: polymerase subunit sigma-70 [Alphaproteobacteria bacterium]|nr:polymerase subunit sigma-70 [Alphaproteobacteria bacterium]MDB5722369.1 polymerase subunit sigma-70 [Alphaproteobacteria bacterium]
MTADPSGLAELYLRHRAELARFLAARTGSREEAEDIVQELWLKLNGADSGPVANGRAYLYRMAQNLVLDRIRERSRRGARERLWQDEEIGYQAGEAMDARSNPEAEAAEREEVALVASAIAALPEGARRAFRLHKIDGLSHSEVAERLGISRSGVEKHIAVAMKHLRQRLAD